MMHVTDLMTISYIDPKNEGCIAYLRFSNTEDTGFRICLPTYYRVPPLKMYFFRKNLALRCAFLNNSIYEKYQVYGAVTRYKYIQVGALRRGRGKSDVIVTSSRSEKLVKI